MSDNPRPVAVIGGGTLGRRIALMFCTGGDVRLVDPAAEQREAAAEYVARELPRLTDAAPGRLTVYEQITDGVADAWLVLECVPERLDVKRAVFTELDGLAPADAILATNSSSYPSSNLVEAISNPERLVNLHFYMPPARRAVEVMSCGQTDPAVLDRLMAYLPTVGLDPFLVRQESVGFIYNRIWAAIKREALAVVEEGVATPEEVDRIYAANERGVGPFARMDGVGLDVVLDIEEHYAAVRPNLPEGPRRLLRRLIGDGRLGRKSGRGFYDYGVG
ncbi:MAG: 3-hydroxybutyryl-CoA dehydrogenase [Frankiaceae bacterium]|nr:3-hydroxybutyryl-CoA dehydrogenase [Frankiaceae bacterium]